MWTAVLQLSSHVINVSISKLIQNFLQIKSNLLLYLLYYAEARNEFVGLISVSLCLGETAPFEEMSRQWRAVGDIMSDLTGPRFEPQTFRYRHERTNA